MVEHREADSKRVRAVISGRVQGVWFRAWTQEEARRRALDGWVMNRRDGAVEAVFQGAGGRVDDMLEACWRGPPHAQVVDVAVSALDEPVEPGFHVRSSRGG
jgi:acylphosphatase